VATDSYFSGLREIKKTDVQILTIFNYLKTTNKIFFIEKDSNYKKFNTCCHNEKNKKIERSLKNRIFMIKKVMNPEVLERKTLNNFYNLFSNIQMNLDLFTNIQNNISSFDLYIQNVFNNLNNYINSFLGSYDYEAHQYYMEVTETFKFYLTMRNEFLDLYSFDLMKCIQATNTIVNH
jgi:hypothetical protein